MCWCGALSSSCWSLSAPQPKIQKGWYYLYCFVACRPWCIARNISMQQKTPRTSLSLSWCAMLPLFPIVCASRFSHNSIMATVPHCYSNMLTSPPHQSHCFSTQMASMIIINSNNRCNNISWAADLKVNCRVAEEISFACMFLLILQHQMQFSFWVLETVFSVSRQNSTHLEYWAHWNTPELLDLKISAFKNYIRIIILIQSNAYSSPIAFFWQRPEDPDALDYFKQHSNLCYSLKGTWYLQDLGSCSKAPSAGESKQQLFQYIIPTNLKKNR